MKKGFTLVEIILSIGLIVLVGTVSIFSFNLIKNNNKTISLEKMSDEILTAVNLYVETNDDVKQQLYQNKNGLKIPLTTLENSGLVDFKDLSDDLTEEDFVVTMLGSSDPNDDTCANTYTAKSWNIKDGETIYICEKSNSEIDDLKKQIEELKKKLEEPVISNFNQIANNTYYFKGADAKNYIKIEGGSTLYRILYVEKDDSLVLYKNTSFGNTFNDNDTLPLDSSRGIKKTKEGAHFIQFTCEGTTAVIKPVSTYYYNYITRNDYTTYNVEKGETLLDAYDVLNTVMCSESGPTSWITNYHSDTDDHIHSDHVEYQTDCEYGKYSYQLYDTISYKNGYFAICGTSYDHIKSTDLSPEDYKIRLKSCWNIISGVGTSADPYIIKNRCQT